MSKTIGVFSGSAFSFNHYLVATHIGQALSEEFSPHLISTDEEFATDVSNSFDDVFGVSYPGTIPGEIKALRTYLQSASPDALFQITNPPLHGSIVGILARFHGIPFVYRYSGDRFYEYQLSSGFEKVIHFGLNNVLGRVPLALADRCIALGPTGVCRLEERGVNRSNVTEIPPGIDPDRFSSPTVPDQLETNRHIGLFVGRLSRKKGKETIERTAPEIFDRRPDIEFVCVGELVESLDISPKYADRITQIGPVSPKKIPDYLYAADFVVHPSLTEGLPRAVLESLASGTPVIARDVGDVSSATANTFRSDSEFANMVCEFETLSVDPIDKFEKSTVMGQYKSLFSNLLAEYKK